MRSRFAAKVWGAIWSHWPYRERDDSPRSRGKRRETFPTLIANDKDRERQVSEHSRPPTRLSLARRDRFRASRHAVSILVGRGPSQFRDSSDHIGAGRSELYLLVDFLNYAFLVDVEGPAVAEATRMKYAVGLRHSPCRRATPSGKPSESSCLIQTNFDSVLVGVKTRRFRVRMPPL